MKIFGSFLLLFGFLGVTLSVPVLVINTAYSLEVKILFISLWVMVVGQLICKSKKG